MNQPSPFALQSALRLVASGFVTVFLTGNLASSRAAEISPAHVYQDVMGVKAQLNLIRLEMGKPPGQEALLRVENAAPREVYFQALTLFRKSNRLAYEHTRKKIEDPPFPSGTIQPQHVQSIVIKAGDRLRLVLEALDVDSEELPATPPLKLGTTPTQVFTAIVDANRAVNALLNQQFAPADVYEQITVAIAYTSRLLEATGTIDAPPKPPDFVRQKRPADVYRLLLECFDKIRKVAEISRLPMLNMVETEQLIEEAEPSDVYDLSTLLVAELNFFYDQIADLSPPRRAYNPGRKLPSHVYQRAGILMKQLDTLIVQAQRNPGWLGVQNEQPQAEP